MNETRSIVVARHMAHPPERIWRALTQGDLVADWLMTNDFQPMVGHRFQFRAKPLPGWSGIVNCEVLEVVSPQRLAYRWGDGTESDTGLSTIVTWTLIPVGDQTLVRMEQAGFRPRDGIGFERMAAGWPRILERLDRVSGMPERS